MAVAPTFDMAATIATLDTFVGTRNHVWYQIAENMQLSLAKHCCRIKDNKMANA
jgi:hypothetical protein